MSKRNKFALLPTPTAVLFRPNSASIRYRKQRCNREGGKQSFNLQQEAFLSGWVQKIAIFVTCLSGFRLRL